MVCLTCGLPVPPTDRRYRFCTATCRGLSHRYPRARSRVVELTRRATESESLERPDLAEREWLLVDVAIRRLGDMEERIRQARHHAGLPVPEDWPPSEAPAGAPADAPAEAPSEASPEAPVERVAVRPPVPEDH